MTERSKRRAKGHMPEAYTKALCALKKRQWISASINEQYSNDPCEGIPELTEGDTVILEIDVHGKRTWYKS